MPRPDPRLPGPGQESMLEGLPITEPGTVTRGRHSEAVDRALDAARSAELIGDVDEALATVVRAGAWALDMAEDRGAVYLPPKMAPAMTEAITALGLTPEARKTSTDDAIRDLLADLAATDDTEETRDGTTAPHTP